MAEVVYFVSDAHLGSGADSREREKQLCRFLDDTFLRPLRQSHSQAITQPKLFLLGDMFDFWFTYRYVVPRGHVRLLGKLAELADAGVEIHFFIGNHDMWMFDYLEKEIGVKMHDEPEVFEMGGKRFLIGHGDGLGGLDRKFDMLRKVFRSRLNQRLFAMLPSSWTFPIAMRWSDNNKEKHAKEDCLHYMGDDREGIVLYCKERMKNEHFDFCIFGHRHTPLVRELDGAVYVNTGDWLMNRNYAVFESGRVRLEEWQYDRAR